MVEFPYSVDECKPQLDANEEVKVWSPDTRRHPGL